MSGKTFLAGAGIFVLVFAGVLAALNLDRVMNSGSKGPLVLEQATPALPVQFSIGRPAFDFTAAARRVVPSVVSVDNFIEGQNFFGQSVVRRRSSGSGVIISRDGYILTNAHVVDGASSLRVRLSDKRTLRAELIGEDSRSDLALLKVQATGLTPATFGDSRGLKAGEWVMAVGSPLGYDSTISVGVVSSTGRVLPTEGAVLVDTIQTDAAINQGNSGGALTNAQGELIGINTAIASNTGGSIGIGFAIPIERAQRVVQDLTQFGRARYGTPGLEYDERDGLLQYNAARSQLQQITRSQTEPPREGLLITDVVQGGPAARAGLKRFDVLVELEGRPVRTRIDHEAVMLTKKPGDRVTMKVWSSGQVRTVSLTLAESA